MRQHLLPSHDSQDTNRTIYATQSSGELSINEVTLQPNVIEIFPLFTITAIASKNHKKEADKPPLFYLLSPNFDQSPG